MRTITLNEDDMGCGHGIDFRVTCGTCQRNWCDKCHPTPSARCLYEYDHDEPNLASLQAIRDQQIAYAINLLEEAGFTVIKDGEIDE